MPLQLGRIGGGKKEVLISFFLRQIFVTWCLRVERIKFWMLNNGTINMTDKVLALNEGKDLTMPNEEISRR
ncbi:hypothetical protein Peur_033379 [Populus x canadensis]